MDAFKEMIAIENEYGPLPLGLEGCTDRNKLEDDKEEIFSIWRMF
jgi:hypothetical protein